MTESTSNLSFPLAPGFSTSRLALGCMHFGNTSSPEGSNSSSKTQIATNALIIALEQGWNLFDLADIYYSGESERVFADAMKELQLRREDVFIQSKCGIRFKGDPQLGSPHRFDFSKPYILKSVDGILSRLKTDYLDILMLHRPDLLMEEDEIADAFSELSTKGKVRFFGVSNHTPILIDLLKKAGVSIIVNQIEINPLRTALLDSSVVAKNRLPMDGHPADGTLEYHRLNGVVTQAWAPMAYGYLSGRAPDWDPERVKSTADVVHQIAQHHAVPREAIVIAWLLRHPAKIQPIIGTRSPARLKNCHQSLQVKLSREEWYSIFLAGRGTPLP